MSTQYSNIFSLRSFSLFTSFSSPLKAYPTHPFLNKRRSRNRTLSSIPPLASQSSSDIVLIATTEHRDGSLVFRFGDASEVVDNDDVLEEIESKAQQESSIVKILDGDQEREVIIKRIERGYGRDVTEVAHGTGNADTDSGSDESETKFTSDSHAESSDVLSDIYEEEVLSSQSDTKLNNSFEVVVDETDSTAQVEVDGNLNPTISLRDNSPNRNNDADPKGTLLKDSDDDETEDSSISVILESTQVSKDDVMDVKQPYDENELDKVKSEDTDRQGLMPISDVELAYAANDYMEEGLNIEELPPPSDILGVEPTLDEVEVTMDEISSIEVVILTDQGMEDELQEVSTNNREGSHVSCKEEAELTVEEKEVSQIQSAPLELKPTMQISNIELEDTTGQYPGDGILQVKEESGDLSVSVNPETIKVSDIELQDTMCPNLDDIVLQVTEKSEEQSVEIFQVLDVELEDTVGQNTDDGVLQVKDQSEDPLVSVELETMQVSNIEVMYVTQAYAEDELDKAETEDTKDLLPPATTHNISDVELTDAANEDMEERLQDMDISEATLIDGVIQSLGTEPTINEVIHLQSSHVECEEAMEVSTDLSVDDELQQVSIDTLDKIDVADVMIIPEQISDFEVEDATCQNLDDGILQVINEEAGDSLTMDVEQSSNKLEGQPVQDDGVYRNMLEQCVETDASESSILLKQDAHDLILEAEQNKENVSGSELTEASEDTALLLAAEAKVKREEIYLTGEFLSSGAALLEHSFKALTGGDDAYFMAGGKWLGVANGVNQWSFEGTDPGVYAQELMRTCEDIVLDTNVPMTNPVELLCRGIKETNMSGSTSVLIASFDGQFLHVANIGDTGFLIVRHGAIYKKSSPLLHEFHFALQVEDCDDLMQLVEECRIELDEGDIVVSATDGLFDNLYEREIAMIVSKSLQAELKPQEIANVLATKAQVVGKSAFVRSPFSDAAQAAGYTGYTGGKPDNVAVIVSLVEKISNLLGE